MTTTELLAAHREMEADGERMTDRMALEIVPGSPIASFTTYGAAYDYMVSLGLRGYTVTADTFLGYAVRKFVPLSSQSMMRRV